MTIIAYWFGILAVCFTLFGCGQDAGQNNPAETVLYHSPASMRTMFADIHAQYPNITLIDSAGTSVSGEDITAFIIAGNPSPLARQPRVRLVGSIHGNENITAELLLRMTRYLADAYSADANIRAMVDSTYICIIPMLNPDGVIARTRYNANGVDLNRNFSTAWQSGYDHGNAPFSEPESRAIRDYSTATVFHLSASFHAGAVVVNMPFDYARESDGNLPGEYALVKQIAKRYTSSGTFLQSAGLMDIPAVEQGTVNGGDWYIVHGSLQDWSYCETGCIDYTIEVALDNPDTEEKVNTVFLQNRDSIIALINAARSGVSGTITSSGTGIPLANVRVSVAGSDRLTRSDQTGFYHAVLLPGSYVIRYDAYGDGTTVHTESSVMLSDANQSLNINVGF